MNESDFRDWARAALRSMDEKIERLAKERAQPAKPEGAKPIRLRMAGLGPAWWRWSRRR